MSEDQSESEFTGPITSRKKFSLANVFGLLLLGLLLLIILGPMFLSCGCKRGDLARAVQNAKQVGYALFNFENDFGSYPNDETLKKLDDDAVLSSSGGSNYYFSQLVAGGYVDQESPFYAQTGDAVQPDNAISTPEEIFSKGEVGFAYVLWDPSMNSGNLDPEAPLVFTLVEKKKSKFLGLFKRRDLHLIVLRVDMSVTERKANDDGVVLVDGKDYFDWSQPHWGGQKPRIVWPE